MPLKSGNKQMDPLTGEITTIKGLSTMSDKNDYITDCNTNKQNYDPLNVELVSFNEGSYNLSQNLMDNLSKMTLNQERLNT